MAGWGSRSGERRSGKAIGRAYNQAQLGRADSGDASFARGKSRIHMDGPTPRPVPAAGQPVKPPGPEADRRR